MVSPSTLQSQLRSRNRHLEHPGPGSCANSRTTRVLVAVVVVCCLVGARQLSSCRVGDFLGCRGESLFRSPLAVGVTS